MIERLTKSERALLFITVVVVAALATQLLIHVVSGMR